MNNKKRLPKQKAFFIAYCQWLTIIDRPYNFCSVKV